MLDKLYEKIKKIFSSRIIPVVIIFGGLFIVLVIRMFQLQIVEASDSADITSPENEYKAERTRYTGSTRGNIYDRSGNLLAYNTLSYSIVMSNSGLVSTNAEKNAMILKLLNILEEHGYEPELEFAIELDENGELVFNVTGNAELRFKKNSYGLKRVADLNEEQLNATAAEVFEFLRFGKKNVSTMFNISEDYSIEDTLKIMKIRYNLFILWPQYSQFTLASNVDEATIAAIMENMAEMPGVEIQQQTSRVYNDSTYFAHILGYTGIVTENEMTVLNENLEEDKYYTSDVIGKIGIEKEMDSTLRGEKGEEQLTINKSGKIIDTKIVKEPVAGDDIYLTIDRELQIACFHILENNVAAILRSKITNSMSYGTKGKSANGITIPIYEVYNAFINNEILDTDHFNQDDATELEKSIYSKFIAKRTEIMALMENLLAYDSTVVNSSTSEETEGYLDYIYSTLSSSGLLKKSIIPEDATAYNEYKNDKISLSEFIREAINNNWIELSIINVGDNFYTTEEIYNKIITYVYELLYKDINFNKKIYRTLIFNYKISGKELCMLLYEQGVLEYNENDYNKLINGRISAYNFVMDKLETLEITPGMLALEPCSGSIVVTDTTNGDVLAMVTYPNYDTNLLANKIDWDYYQSLMNNQSKPLINRPTQQGTATGSTFKPLMALAGFGEGLITPSTTIKDQGIFTEVEPSPKCWYYPSNHGYITASGAIKHSCNYFFFDLGYRMALDSDGIYSDSLGIAKIQKYAALFGLTEKTGVEVPETAPVISGRDAVRTAIGYYHNLTPAQISRYVTAVASRGSVYDFTIIDKIVDKNNNLVTDYEAVVLNQIDQFSDAEWDAVHKGMYDVVNSSGGLRSIFGNLGYSVAGKTGTAQVSLTHPSHGLFISFAPYEAPKVSVTVVLPNGYASANAAKLAREVYGLYFNDENKEELLSGDLTTTSVTSINVSD